MSKPPTRIKDISKRTDQLFTLDTSTLPKLPYPYEDWVDPPIPEVPEVKRAGKDLSLDGVMNVSVPSPDTEEERERLVAKFLEGLRKLLSRENNWMFLKPLMLSIDNCVKCNTCSEACPIFEMSGRAEIYRPLFRSDILRRIIKKYIIPGGKMTAKLTGADIDLTWDTLARLAHLSYRCTLCRRCAQACPMGVDNGLIAREIRKLFSQELGIAAAELHTNGTVKQLKTGSSTGLSPTALMDIFEFMEEDLTDRTGLNIKMPFDKAGADILLIHNAGEFLSWPENIEAFAVIFEAAGLNWTMSSELVGYDSVNYGLFYEDVQLARVTLKHAEIARKLGVKKVVVAECGHAHKAAMAVGDRIWLGENNIPRESCLVILEDLVVNEKIKVDPERNNFPVTLHDPCNITRSMGIIEPQRRVVRKICPKFREMTPHGVNNYCCGGGSGFAIMQSNNFPNWRFTVPGRKKFAQILNAFTRDELDPKVNKYLCAPCSNCKGQIRDLLTYYDAWERVHIQYGGLVELVVNCMSEIREGFIEWDEFH
ncbi:MAG: (Fe-S)-binding protein [Candidatus Zixiibacteriota bacterium]|nr:MAG: (Fe-S)-binding protein [candidate division Zixibacteria bacterium]